MAILLRHTDDSVQWGVWKMDESIDELLTLLPRKEWYREYIITRFRTDHRKLEWLSVRVLLRQLIGEEREIAYLSSGKPYLADGSYYISITHTKGYVAVILSKLGGVGIDVEQYGSRIQKVAHKFMRDDEVATAYQGDETWGLLLHWSAKEVMFKCMDVEGVDFREHLYIEPFAFHEPENTVGDIQGIFLAEEYKTGERQKFRIHYLLRPDFVLTWYCALY